MADAYEEFQRRRCGIKEVLDSGQGICIITIPRLLYYEICGKLLFHYICTPMMVPLFETLGPLSNPSPKATVSTNSLHRWLGYLVHLVDDQCVNAKNRGKFLGRIVVKPAFSYTALNISEPALLFLRLYLIGTPTWTTRG